MTRFKTLSMAAMIALAVGSSLSGAMAQTAGGGGSAGDGGGSGLGFDPPAVTHATVPGSTIPRQTQMQDNARFCGFELLRGHFCERGRR
ncbi:hypothetical protein ACJ4V0_03655 [Phreatobacter sp. HK31-P]|nr:hypothetical protein [Phreatobacter sp.]